MVGLTLFFVLMRTKLLILRFKMDEIELYRYIYSNRLLINNCNGIYSSNDLPTLLKSGFYIVNTDPNYLPGSHWVALYINKNNYAYYFDSLGNVPINSVANILDRNKITYDYNTKRIQGDKSDVCGDYCLLFVYLACQGYILKSFISLFGDDRQYNDRLVEL